MTLTRTFHPVGQGGFASEVFEEPGQGKTFVMVYDCGGSAGRESVVQEFFTAHQVIDLLCISHWHRDHVGFLPVVKKQKVQVKRVFMPFWDSEMKKLLFQYHSLIGDQDLAEFYNDPQAFFGPETEITILSPLESNEPARGGQEPQVPAEFKNPITLGAGFWIYIPFMAPEPRDEDLLIRIEKFKIRLDSVVTMLQIGKMDNNLNLESEQSLARAVYDEMGVDLNRDGLMLVSCPPKGPRGPVSGGSSFIQINPDSKSALYTGDGYLKSRLVNYLKTKDLLPFHTVQVPHHGSNRNTEVHSLTGLGVPGGNWILQHGAKRYGHPSNELCNDLLQMNLNLVHVCEQDYRIFVEKF